MSHVDTSFYLAQKLAQLQKSGAKTSTGANYTTVQEVAQALANAGLTAAQHFTQFGQFEGLSPNANFDVAQYYAAKANQLNTAGVAKAGGGAWTALDVELNFIQNKISAWNHFTQFGFKEGVNPSNAFDLEAYYASKAANLTSKGSTNNGAAWTAATVKAFFIANNLDPVTHFIDFGKTEGVTVTPVATNKQVPGGSNVSPNLGQTFTLTTGVDTVAGGTGDDTISATATTLSVLDSIDGGAGTDTLSIVNTGGTVSTVANTTVKNVENLSIVSTTNAITYDVSAFTGLTSVTVAQSDKAAGTDITSKANVTTVSVTGGTTVNLNDSNATAGADTLKSVTLSGNTGAATIASDALTSLSLASSNQNATVTAAAGTRALALSINGLTGGTVTDATATTLTVTSAGTKTTGVTLAAAATTTVSIDAAVDTSLVSLDAAKATTLTVKGAGLTTIAGLNAAALTTFDASGSTGGLALTPAIGNAVAFIGGSGKDSVSVGATTKSIALGDGDDTATVGVAALGTGGALAGGNGVDTLSISATNAATASATATFAAAVTGFERLTLTGATNQTVDLKALGNYNFVTTSGGNGLTLQNAAADSTLTLNGAGTAYTVALADATGAADKLNVTLTDGSGAGVAFAATGITANNVETIAITTADTQTTPSGTFNDTVTLLGNSAKTITVAGNAGLTLTATTTAATSVDASGITKGGFSFTSGALAAAAAIKGSATGANTVDFSAATKAVTYTGGTGVDTVTANNGQDNSITTGDGNDAVTLGAGKNTVDLGAGNDTITLGVNLNVVTLGGGTDTVTVVASTNVNTYSEIKDAVKGDVLTFTDKGTEVFTTAKITLGNTAVFQDYANAAAAGDGSVNGRLAWFQFGGDTYLVEDVSAGATFVNGTDLIVKLTGLVDLSTATGAGTNALTLA